MPKFDEVRSWIDGILELAFGDAVPPLLTLLVRWGIVVIALALAVWGLLSIAVQIVRLARELRPLFYDYEQRRRVENRRRLSLHLKAQLDSLNARESWQEFRFTELEAEVDAEGRLRRPWLPVLPLPSRRQLRREKSLTSALRSSSERLILLEGEPGSGKSIALRHIALSLAIQGMRARSAKKLIPLYINLKTLTAASDEVTADIIKEFVLEKVIGNNSYIEEFLVSEFDRGLAEGTWLFLFDSFDEIPAVLGSTEADDAILRFAEAVNNFLHGLNKCRGIVASRYFRGPGRLSWPRFKIRSLSRTRRQKLVRRMNLDRAGERLLLAWLDEAPTEVRQMSENPMFLGLVAEHVHAHGSLPDTRHAVFEGYITSRLRRDEGRVARRFGLDEPALRQVAETVAFAMAAEPGLGLSPRRADLQAAMARLSLSFSFLPRALDALIYLRFARAEDDELGSSTVFSFAHRRFQEYFATCELLRRPKAVSPRVLLTDGRWRESTVVLFQTQEPDQLVELVGEARKILGRMVESEREGDCWPRGFLHLASLLQDGYGGRMDALPSDVRKDLGVLLRRPFPEGSILDRRSALEVAGAAPVVDLSYMVEVAFASGSEWLKDSAYRQVGRLTSLSGEILESIRETLVRQGRAGRLWRERFATVAHLSRLSGGHSLLKTHRQLLWCPAIHGSLLVFALLSLLWVVASGEGGSVSFLLAYAVMLGIVGGLLWLEASVVEVIRLYLVALPVLVLLSPFAKLIPQVNFEPFSSAREILLSAAKSSMFGRGVAGLLTAGLLCYAVLWGPFMVAAARRGALRHPALWLFAPFEPILRLFRASAALRVRRLVAFLIAVVLVVGFSWLNSTYSIVNTILTSVVAVLVWASVIVGLFWVWRRFPLVVRRIGGYFWLWRLELGGLAVLGLTQLKLLVEEARKREVMARFVEVLAASEAVERTEAVVQYLRSEIERSERRGTIRELDAFCRLFEQTNRAIGSAN